MDTTTYTAAATRYNAGMDYRRCGRSGILMSRFSLGFWHNFGSISNFDNAKAMMEAAFDRGITCFDLANNYGPAYGTAEETFGKLMDLSFRPYRDEMFVTTKAGYDMWDGPYGNWGSRKYLLSSLDQSLKRLHLDYVDLFYSHRFDPNTPLDETLGALVTAVHSGRALYAGISNYPVEAADYAYKFLKAHDTPCLCYQGKLNLLVRQHTRPGDILDLSADAGVGYAAFSPLAEGLLTDRYLNGIPADSRMARREHLTPDKLTPALLEQLHAFAKLAAARGETLAETALAWVLQDPRVTTVILGTSSVRQLDTNLRALRAAPITPAERAAIESTLTPQ